MGNQLDAADDNADDEESTTIGMGATVSILSAALVIILVLRWAICDLSSPKAKFAPVRDNNGRKKPGRARPARLTMKPAVDDDEDSDEEEDSEEDDSDEEERPKPRPRRNGQRNTSKGEQSRRTDNGRTSSRQQKQSGGGGDASHLWGLN